MSILTSRVMVWLRYRKCIHPYTPTPLSMRAWKFLYFFQNYWASQAQPNIQILLFLVIEESDKVELKRQFVTQQNLA